MDNRIIWIRNKAVDIKRYLPFFLQKEKIMNDILDACSREHERLRLDIIDLFNQFFVETATWGLELWENDLDIVPDADADYASRRLAILSRLQTRHTSTVAYVTEVVNRYITKKNAEVIEDNEHYAYELRLEDGTVIDWDGLLDALTIWVPAHIGRKIIASVYLHGGYWFSGVISEVQIINIGTGE